MSIPCDVAIGEGKCKGDCCGVVRLDRDVYEAVILFMAVKPEQIKQIYYVEGNKVVVLTYDRRCAFMDRKTYRCGIYEQRPEVCRKYGTINELKCPYYDTEGSARTRARRRQAKREISRYVIKNRVQLQMAIKRARNRERRERELLEHTANDEKSS